MRTIRHVTHSRCIVLIQNDATFIRVQLFRLLKRRDKIYTYGCAYKKRVIFGPGHPRYIYIDVIDGSFLFARIERRVYILYYYYYVYFSNGSKKKKKKKKENFKTSKKYELHALASCKHIVTVVTDVVEDENFFHKSNRTTA